MEDREGIEDRAGGVPVGLDALGELRELGIPTLGMTDPSGDVFRYVLHARLLGADPGIWRRFEIDGRAWLIELGESLSIMFGWAPSASYRLHLRDGREEFEGTRARRIDEVLSRSRDGLLYECHGWRAAVTLREVRRASTGGFISPRVLDGAGAGPPADCAGPVAYADVLRQLAEPERASDDLSYADWLKMMNPDFDPDRFDASELTAKLTQYGAEGLDEVRAEPIALVSESPLRRELLTLIRRTAGTRGISDAGHRLIARPWLVVLESIGEGVESLAGRLPPQVCRHLLAELYPPAGEGRWANESDSTVLRALRGSAEHLGLIRTIRDRIEPTALGRELRGREAAIYRHVCRTLPLETGADRIFSWFPLIYEAASNAMSETQTAWYWQNLRALGLLDRVIEELSWEKTYQACYAISMQEGVANPHAVMPMICRAILRG